jgi:carbamate kinase
VLTVLALGGNALLRPDERGTAAEHRANLATTFSAVTPLLQGEVVVTHGNGPQVGNELLRQELGSAEAPPLPLWVAVAQTQAEIGTLAATELAAVVGKEVAVVVTHVVVDPADPAFERPTKPIGPHYPSGRAQELERDRGWTLKEEPGRGWRRVVPSPKPLEIVELEAVRALLATGQLVVAAGGGGIPVVRRDDAFDGIDAVIDKDHASALLAVGLAAERLVILTEVPGVYREFGADGGHGEPIAALDPERDARIVEELPAGSMRPKVEAAFAFVTQTGGEAVITSAEAVENDEAGTRVAPASIR